MKLSDFKVLTFDCYGTLIDWESGMVQALAPLTDQLGGKLSRNEILKAHARHESSQQRQTQYKRYRELLAIVYRRHAQQGFGATMHPGEMLHYDFRLDSMDEMAEAYRREMASR